jgi:hypothetical protein
MKSENMSILLKPTFQLLHLTFIIVPIVAGADKYFNLLTNWGDYVSPSFASLLPFSIPTFMMVVGIIEIIAGILVWKKPETGGYIVSAWLCLIALTLLASWHHADVAVRDLVMALSAWSMARISKIFA